jgi:hypothetical protein
MEKSQSFLGDSVPETYTASDTFIVPMMLPAGAAPVTAVS